MKNPMNIRFVGFLICVIVFAAVLQSSAQDSASGTVDVVQTGSDTAPVLGSGPGEIIAVDQPQTVVVDLTFNPRDIDQQIEKLRKELKAVPKDKMRQAALSELLLKKAYSMRGGAKFQDVEPLILEAYDLTPDSFQVHYIWGCFIFFDKNYEAALPRFETALALKPDHLDCIMKLGVTLLNMMRYEEAFAYFERAQKQIPKDFYLFYFLGKCQFELKDFERAIEFWEEALKLAANEKDAQAIQQLINKAKEQDASIAGTTKDENQRFIVHYAGNSQKDIGDMTMEILEEIYENVTSDLMYHPEIKINVIFFLTQEFYELNRTGNWVGAITQGEKILVPLQQGYSDMNSVKGILAHEFTHVVVNLRTTNRCPTWVNEGLAVYQEFKAMYGDPNQMRPDYEKIFNQKIINERTIIPLKQINLNPSQQTYGYQIPLGYLESYLAIRFMIERWNFQGVDQLLEGLSQGNYFEESLENATSLNYSQFESEFNDYLKGF